MSAKYAALDIARWILAWSEGDEEGDISHLKLQKLLYYAQGYHLAKTGEPLFSESIQAWAHGPVVASVYREFRDFGGESISLEGDFDWDSVDRDTSKLLVEVWNTFGVYSAWKLRQMTHQESPWRDNFQPEVHSITIPNEEIERYFKAQLSSV